MIIIASLITTFTIIIITNILLIFIGVEYQLGHRPVFFSSCRYYSVRVTNFNKVIKQRILNWIEKGFKVLESTC